MLLGIFSGMLLTLVIQTNGVLAKNTSPLMASWVAHGVGALGALLLIMLISRWGKTQQPQRGRPAWFYYLGGFSGAMTVILSTFTLNGGVPLSSVIALGLVGQVVFSIFSDSFGILGSIQRRITWVDSLVILLVTTGSLLIVFDLTGH
ncbi:DMT family transporter [Thiofilum flexile]|uniref:DMT family transporter n=1 Tax=Thiofilum flexile TaxID=125627 RepID=UPI0003A3B32C|nr:DMT family transporter [Thiofilum flexile]